MRKKPGHLIKSVVPGSPAERAGISAGERLLRMDNSPIHDIIDYKIMEADGRVQLLLLDRNGRARKLSISKGIETPLGLQFASPTLAPVKKCRNRCFFCFIKQNPTGLRRSLYLKDDDYRLSFLFGNFITLNGLRPEEMERIVKLRLSPLYISVHATDPGIRLNMFGTKKAPRGFDYLRKLLGHGIETHLQIVLCPGYNTGQVLDRTIEDLAALGSGVLSIALVPVGLTIHRPSGLPPLRKLTSQEAQKLTGKISRLQKKFMSSRGTRLLYLADEIYTLAGEAPPAAEEYEGFPQLENGVGLTRLFLDELAALPVPPLGPLPGPLRATLASGEEAEPLIKKLISALYTVPGLSLKQAVVVNNFFGNTVTVSGLLTGQDLVESLQDQDLGDALFITRSMLKEGEEVFLDGMTLGRLEKLFQLPVVAVQGPKELAEKLRDLAAGKAAEVQEDYGH